MKTKMKIITISDGTGQTANAVCKAIMTQFKHRDVNFTSFKNVRTKEKIDAIFQEAAIHHDMIIHTIVSPQMREYMSEQARLRHIRSLDLIGPAITAFSNYFDQEPNAEPGLLHAVNEEYFQRVAAMEFTLNHDDGRNLKSLHLADVVLVGISRTSKTPLSVYLSQMGIKVVNVPLIMGTRPPKELFEIDQRKIFALTIDSEALKEIRKKRLSRLGASGHTGDYADTSKVISELDWANNLFKENKRWPLFNVTNKAIEETAAEIVKLLNMRRNNVFKQRTKKSRDDIEKEKREQDVLKKEKR